MSRSTFLTTNEIPPITDRRYRHGLMTTNRTNESIPIVVQSSPTKITNTSITRKNPRIKRNLRENRRSTGIRPNDISLASTSTEGSANEDEEEEEEENASTLNTDPNESFVLDRTIIPSKPVFSVSRVQSSFENLSIPRTDPYINPSSSSSNKIFRPEEFFLCRIDKQTSNDDSSTLKERIHALESIIFDKDNIIHDLQRKIDNMTRDLTDAEQQICKLHQDKLTLIKAFTAIQDNKPPSRDLSKHSNFVTRK